MIRHIVTWKLADEALGATKAQNAARLKREIEALAGIVPGMGPLEVGIEAVGYPGAWDVVLVSEFESREALEAYQVHPAHEAVKELVAAIRTERAAVDYEV